jgi:magnesium chelatase family protein
MIAKLFGSALYGVDAFRVTIEVSVSNGIGYQITGLPDDAIKESLSRIATSITSNGFHMPRTKLVINLAPADVRKTGTAFDLAIAMGILLASGQVNDLDKLRHFTVVGELGLDGCVYPVRGALCMACQALRDGFRGIILPGANGSEAALVKGLDVYPVKTLKDLISFLKTDFSIEPIKAIVHDTAGYQSIPDFKDVRGQQGVKRALEVAAAGGHNALLIGPPGEGKSMLVRRLPSILPPMSLSEALETTRIYSVAAGNEPMTGLVTQRPFRSPHHTASDVSLTGGGSIPVPGEISLAHNGVLFLDELPEFKRSAIEVLRQPIEERKVLISRARMSLEFPSSFMLVAAMNPCQCGYFGHPFRTCTCSRRAIYWYRRKISGPMIERIDIHIEVDSVSATELMDEHHCAEPSSVVRDRVIRARNLQLGRYAEKGMVCNAQMPDHEIEKYCRLEGAAKTFLFKKMNQFQLSARSYVRILKVSRTIADLAGSQVILLPHLAEALHFRCLDKPFVFPYKRSMIMKTA